MTSITFVTAFLNIYDKNYYYFEKLAKSGINICLYTNEYCYNKLDEFLKSYPNVKLMNSINLEDTIAYNISKNIDFSLPQNRNIEKDTTEYLIFNNSKVEFVMKAINENPWKSTHFAWIDLNIAALFKKLDSTIHQLYTLSKRTFLSNTIILPGCFSKLENIENIENILNNVKWRFCGSFFIGDIQSIRNFYELSISKLEPFMLENKKLIWEVNYWAWLEATTDWKPDWYKGDHNDSIFDIPTKYYANFFNNNMEIHNYNYPIIEKYFQSNTSYLFHCGKHILNTRFVNYSYSPKGTYIINHPNNTINTKNIVSNLDDNLIPIDYNEMSEENIGITSHDMYSVGLEDIRLYSYNGIIKFIATNVNYVGNRANRMIVGEYDIDTLSYKNSKIIQPPVYTNCEKNWIPVVQNNNEFFIYTWSPFQLGKINYDVNQLEIVKSYEIISPDFYRIRGSSIFTDNGENLIGVVHFCEETFPRQYYHMLVTLDKETLRPLLYSDPFCFQHYGVEFCIGFTIKDSRYFFWVTKKDNDTTMVSINFNEIPINHTVKYR
jgi:hypothetical protein